MEYVRRLAVKNQNARRNELLNMLREEGIPYLVKRAELGVDDRVENVIVPIHTSERRLVIGAHYDSVEGSTGANDNAAAVSVLIRLAKKMIASSNSPSVDIVFFDKEEQMGIGSEFYIKDIGREKISAMINLDVCGYGEVIAVNTKQNEGNPAFGKLFDKKILDRYPVRFLDYLPDGDDKVFSDNRIPNISICVLTHKDISIIQEANNKAPEEVFTSLDVMRTIHNGDLDNITSVSPGAMELLYKYLADGLL